MVFIETPSFTSEVKRLLPDDDYRDLQQFIADQPDAGDLVRGTGGLRKIRWGTDGRGKRAGILAIYYWHVREWQVLMLAIYPKNERIDLSADEQNALRVIVEKWK